MVVEVAHSLISAGTELSIVKPQAPALLERVQHTTDRAQRLIEHLRQTGIRKTFAKAYGKLRDRQADVGRPIGYSCSGTVVQVGAGVSGLHPGDLVACAGAGAASHAELVLVPKALTVRIPQGVSLRDASSVAVGAIALQGVRRAGATVGEVVAVVGLGLIGQLTVQLLAAAGCRVVGIDLDPRRVALALAHGAERALEPSMVDVKNELLHATGGHGVDVTVVTAGGAGSELVQTAMEVTRKKGRVVIVGAVGMDLQRSPFYEKELDFLISTSYGPGRYDTHYEADGVDYPFAYVRWTEARNMEEYLRLIASGKVRLEHVLEQDYPLAEAAQAYAALGSARAPSARRHAALRPRQGRGPGGAGPAGAGHARSPPRGGGRRTGRVREEHPPAQPAGLARAVPAARGGVTTGRRGTRDRRSLRRGVGDHGAGRGAPRAGARCGHHLHPP